MTWRRVTSLCDKARLLLFVSLKREIETLVMLEQEASQQAVTPPPDDDEWCPKAEYVELRLQLSRVPDSAKFGFQQLPAARRLIDDGSQLTAHGLGRIVHGSSFPGVLVLVLVLVLV